MHKKHAATCIIQPQPTGAKHRVHHCIPHSHYLIPYPPRVCCARQLASCSHDGNQRQGLDQHTTQARTTTCSTSQVHPHPHQAVVSRPCTRCASSCLMYTSPTLDLVAAQHNLVTTASATAHQNQAMHGINCAGTAHPHIHVYSHTLGAGGGVRYMHDEQSTTSPFLALPKQT